MLDDSHFDEMFLYCVANNDNLKLSHFNEDTELFYFLTKQNVRVCTDHNFWMLAGVFGKESYSPVPYHILTDYIVIDFGMNRAYASLYFASDPNCKKIYGFEPCKSTFDFALYNINMNPELAKKIEYFNVGVASKEDIVTLYKLKDHDESATLDINQIKLLNPHAKPNDIFKESIKIMKSSDVVKKILASHKNEKIVLKIDIEGMEEEVLNDLYENDLINIFDIIVGEIHNNCQINELFKSYEKVHMVRENENQYEFCFKKNHEAIIQS